MQHLLRRLLNVRLHEYEALVRDCELQTVLLHAVLTLNRPVSALNATRHKEMRKESD